MRADERGDLFSREGWKRKGKTPVQRRWTICRGSRIHHRQKRTPTDIDSWCDNGIAWPRLYTITRKYRYEKNAALALPCLQGGGRTTLNERHEPYPSLWSMPRLNKGAANRTYLLLILVSTHRMVRWSSLRSRSWLIGPDLIFESHPPQGTCLSQYPPFCCTSWLLIAKNEWFDKPAI